MASGVALTSAGVECFDIVLACHLLINREGKFIVDPSQEQLNKVSREGGQWAAVTIGMMPAMEKVIRSDKFLHKWLGLFRLSAWT